jgi:hypothetical protein
VGAQRLAHALGSHRAAAQRQHAPARALEQLQHHLLLAFPEGRLALAVEERRDRLAEPALELVVRVERPDPELRRGRACGRGLAGAHEADEHQRSLRYARLHPIRSR